MKHFLFASLLSLLFSCSTNSANEEKTQTKPTKVMNVQATALDAFIDTLSSSAKQKKLTEASVSQWYDTYCPTCNNRCCNPCTAGGPPGCAETRFRECSKCGHASSGHYAVLHN